MANRTDTFLPPDDLRSDPAPDPMRRLEQARAELSRTARFAEARSAEARAADRGDHPAGQTPLPAGRHIPYDPAAVAARIDLMRGRFGKARSDVVSALLFLGDAQRDCDALSDACAENGWTIMADGVTLLSDVLRRALPSEQRHLDLVALLIDALYALRRAETRPDMGRAGADLLRGLKLAASRELPATA
jgi:hypothetical protein